MSVNPGFGGQALPAREPRQDPAAEAARFDERGPRAQIEVDGGVDAGNVRALVEAGAEILVAGSAVFGAGRPRGRRSARLLEAGA